MTDSRFKRPQKCHSGIRRTRPEHISTVHPVVQLTAWREQLPPSAQAAPIIVQTPSYSQLQAVSRRRADSLPVPGSAFTYIR